MTWNPTLAGAIKSENQKDTGGLPVSVMRPVFSWRLRHSREVIFNEAWPVPGVVTG